MYRGAYAAFTGDPSREARLWAAVVRAGPGAVLSHETAAEVHGLTNKPSSQIHVCVPAGRHPGRHRKIRGVVIHRARCLVPQWQPPWTTVKDTARRHREALPDRRGDRYGPAPPRLEGQPAPVRPRLSSRPKPGAGLNDEPEPG